MASESNALDILYQSAHQLSDAHIKFSEGNKDSFKDCVQHFQIMLDNAKIGPKYETLVAAQYISEKAFNAFSEPIEKIIGYSVPHLA